MTEAAPRNFAAGLWRLADPKISLASFAAMTLAACAAAADGPLHGGWLGLTVLGIFAIEVAKNASGEVVDYDSGTDLAVAPEDASPFSGGKRVLVDGLLSRGETMAIAGVSYGIGIVVGLAIAWLRAPGILWLGLVGVLSAYLYHAAPGRLSYRGYGEVVVGLCYGPLVSAGTYLVQRGRVSAEILNLSLPLGLLVMAFLWINEFPDYRADRACGKRNLVVRLGRERATWAFVAIVTLAFVVAASAPVVAARGGSALGLVAFVPAAMAARTLVAHPTRTARIIPAQVRTLTSFVLYAVATGVGLLIAR